MNRCRRLLLPAWLALLIPVLSVPVLSVAQDSPDLSVDMAPPDLPVYDQPPIPGDGYIWTPGYWAWSNDAQDYYWVPGTWISAPEPDYLWTPGYWGVVGPAFLWHAGYWGPHVGFYGGVNYGYGYGGRGYEGGYWRGGEFYYNRSVNNINNVQVTNVYNKTVINNITVNRVSYNGGNGIHVRPSAADLAAAHEPHIAVTPAQRQHEHAALSNPSLRASQNRGRPPIAATSRPGALTGAGIVGSRHPGTFSVVHSDGAAHPAPVQRTGPATPPSARPAPGRPPAQELQPREGQPRPEPRRAPEVLEQPHPGAPPPRPSAPRPVPHPAEPEEEHAHH